MPMPQLFNVCQVAPAINISPTFASYSDCWSLRSQFPNHFQADFRRSNLPFAFPSPAQARHKTRVWKVILDGNISFTWRKIRRDAWLNGRSSSGDIMSPSAQILMIALSCQKNIVLGANDEFWQVSLTTQRVLWSRWEKNCMVKVRKALIHQKHDVHVVQTSCSSGREVRLACEIKG